MSEEKQVRVSKVYKNLKRTIRTAQYESLIVEVGYEEDIEWSDIKERQKKSSDILKVLIHDLKTSIDTSISELGLNEVIGYQEKSGEAVKGVTAKSAASSLLDQFDKA